jgi:hypothetical protein
MDVEEYTPPPLAAHVAATEAITGCYLTADRRVGVVVAVRKGKVFVLAHRDCTIALETSWPEKFLRDYPAQLPRYPVRRAVRLFAKWIHEGFKCTPEAAQIIRAMLKE